MRKMQFAPKNSMPIYHEKAAGEEDALVDAFVKDNILVIDFYRKQTDKWSALWRTLINEKEYCNFDYEAQSWNGEYIHHQAHRHTDAYGRVFGIWEEQTKVTEKSRDIIEKYITKVGGYICGELETTILRMEENLAYRQRETEKERKHDRIQKKMKELPGTPEDFEKVILSTTFKNDHILYFNKEEGYCSRCGRQLPGVKKEHNEHGKCPKCRKPVVFKHMRYMKEHAEEKELLYIQPFKEEVVLRYFKCALISTCHSKEKLEMVETVRTYHSEDMTYFKKRYICYLDCLNRKYWSDKMNPYCTVAYGRNTTLYVGNMEQVREIVNQKVCDIMEITGSEGERLPVIDLLRGYSEERVLLYEKFYKAGLPKLALEVLKKYWDFPVNREQNELKKILKISKPMLRYMVCHNGDKAMLEIMQDAFANQYGLSDDKIFELAAASIKASELAEVSEKNKIIKTFHYLRKANGYKSLKGTFSHYRDYISMASSMGYDLSNGTVRFPNNLKQAHDNAVTSFYEEESDKRKREVLKKYPNIRNLEQTLNEQYSFKTKDYVIMAPHSAADIVEEGRTLHHCVGGDTYLEKHNKGRTFILFMRKAKKPDKRYYTIEIDPKDNRIIQYYGANDKQPDKEAVDVFLKQWKRYLNKKATHKAAG